MGRNQTLKSLLSSLGLWTAWLLMDGKTTKPCGESSEHSSDGQCHRSEDRTLTHVKKTNTRFTGPWNLSQGPSLHQGISSLGKQSERFSSQGACPFLPSFLPTTSPVSRHRILGIDRLMEGVRPDTTSRGHKLSSGNYIRKLGTSDFPSFPSEEKLFCLFCLDTH